MPADTAAQPLKTCRKTGTKKKTVIAVSAAIIAAALLLCGFVLYSYLTPVIDLAISRPVDANAGSWAQTVTVGYSTKLGLPLPPNIRKALAEFGKANSEALLALHENYTSPMRIEASVSTTDGQTTVIYSGTATDKNGDIVPYEKRLTFDFVLTKKMP